MRRGLVAGMLAAVALTAAAPAARAACPDEALDVTSETISRVEAALHCVVGEERTRRGLPPLTPDSRLDLAARRHAADMVRRGFFSHDAPPPAPDGRTFEQRVASAAYDMDTGGEAIYTGSTATARHAVTVLLASAGHCEILLDGRRYVDLGAGVADREPGGGGGGTVVLIAAHESGDPFPSPPDDGPSTSCPIDPSQPPPPPSPPPPAPAPPAPGTSPPAGSPSATPPPDLGTMPAPPRPSLTEVRALPRRGGRLAVRGRLRPAVTGTRLRIRARRGKRVRTVRRTTRAGGRFRALMRAPGGRGRLRVAVLVPRRPRVHAARAFWLRVG